MSVDVKQTDNKIENTTNPVIPATPEQKAEVKQESPAIKTEENQENWRKFREQREQERKLMEQERKRAVDAEANARQRQEESEALKKALEAVVNKPQYPQYDQQEESEEQRIEKKVQEALARERKKHEDERKVREQQELPQRLSSTYSDFNNVCSSENLDYLEYHYPEVAAAYKQAPDGFEKWSNVYKAVKRFVPNVDGKKEIAKAERNLQKPQSMSIPGAVQGSNAMPPRNLDDSKRSENWARMQRIINKLE